MKHAIQYTSFCVKYDISGTVILEKIFLRYTPNFQNIPLRKKNQNPLFIRMHTQRLVEFSPMVLKMKSKCDKLIDRRKDGRTDRRRITGNQNFSLEPLGQGSFILQPIKFRLRVKQQKDARKHDQRKQNYISFSFINFMCRLFVCIHKSNPSLLFLPEITFCVQQKYDFYIFTFS